MKKVIDALNKYKQSQKSIESRRKYWRNIVRPLVTTYFRNVCDYYNELYLEENEDIQNKEQVFLSFRLKKEFRYNQETIYNQQENRKGWILKRGAYLSVSQKIDGNLHIWMAYPNIEELMQENAKAKTIDEIDIESLTQESLEGYVLHFLNEATLWPNHENKSEKHIPDIHEGDDFSKRTPIGFKYKTPDEPDEKSTN